MVRRKLMNPVVVIPSCLEELLVKKYPDKYFLGKTGIGMQLFAGRTCVLFAGLFLFCDCIFRITILLTILVSENTTNRLVTQLPVHRTGEIRRVNYRCTREEEQWKVLETDWQRSEKNIT